MAVRPADLAMSDKDAFFLSLNVSVFQSLNSRSQVTLGAN